MVSVLFNIYDRKIIYTEIIGTLRDYSVIRVYADYILERNENQRKRRWYIEFDAYTNIFVINQNSSIKPTGLYESIDIDGCFST